MSSPTEKLRLRRMYRNGTLFPHAVYSRRRRATLPEAVRIQLMVVALWMAVFASIMLGFTLLFGLGWVMVKVLRALVDVLWP